MNNIDITDIGRAKIQGYSEVDLFNQIGLMTIAFGYKAVYFKKLLPKLIEGEDGYEVILEYVHYIHLHKDEELKYSILYDEYNIASMFPEKPYYELYDMVGIEKFLDTEDGRSGLLINLITLICNS